MVKLVTIPISKERNFHRQHDLKHFIMRSTPFRKTFDPWEPERYSQSPGGEGVHTKYDRDRHPFENLGRMKEP